ncbi:MAG: ribosome recycling factor [Chlamydiae bacterium]|nr:ribosome recycling factor [Chlamydiota bacterium]MBI3277348.1 ribosome recycling factor [Chlamydiota bacterium]
MTFEEKVLGQIKEKMTKTIEFFQDELSGVRSGRANPALVEGMMVNYYGTPTKLKELAGITAPEPRSLVIQPWDIAAIEEIMKALNKNESGLVPKLEGKIIRIQVPELSEQRRNELKKVVKNMAEEARVNLRNTRREMNEFVKKGQKNSQITEDDLFRIEKEVQIKTDDFIKKVDDILIHKEKELTQV